MKRVRTEDAVGCILCHDIARIVIGEVKDTPFRRGQVVKAEDVEILKQLGKCHLFVMEDEDFNKIHEEDVAAALYEMCANEHMHGTEVREGKIELVAEVDGLFKVDVKRLNAINGIGELNIVTLLNNTPVKNQHKLAGMRCVPLLLEKEQLEAATKIFNNKPLVELKPFLLKKAAVVTTGSEVASGKIKDAFTPIIAERIAEYGVEIIAHEIVTDDKELIITAIKKCKDAGAEIIFCTGGMSVDPDDLTPGAIASCASEVVTYGLPVLPGSMFAISYMADGTPLIGVPGGVLFSKPTAFDVLLPRFIAKDKISKAECVALGHGGFLSK